jgi:hypothetical protein
MCRAAIGSFVPRLPWPPFRELAKVMWPYRRAASGTCRGPIFAVVAAAMPVGRWHTYDLPDAMKVVRLRKFVRSPAVQSALQRSSDTLLAFTLRAVELVIADQSRTDREMIRRLWNILLNNPHLIQAMWLQNSPFGPSWLSARSVPGYVGTRKATARS